MTTLKEWAANFFSRASVKEDDPAGTCILVYGMPSDAFGPSRKKFPDIEHAKNWLVSEAFPNDRAVGGHVENAKGEIVAGPWYRRDFR